MSGASWDKLGQVGTSWDSKPGSDHTRDDAGELRKVEQKAIVKGSHKPEMNQLVKHEMREGVPYIMILFNNLLAYASTRR